MLLQKAGQFHDLAGRRTRMLFARSSHGPLSSLVGWGKGLGLRLPLGFGTVLGLGLVLELVSCYGQNSVRVSL